jgi:hypothetical protein
MAEQRDVTDRLERGKRCVEQMSGIGHDIADMYWDRYEDITPHSPHQVPIA